MRKNYDDEKNYVRACDEAKMMATNPSIVPDEKTCACQFLCDFSPFCPQENPPYSQEIIINPGDASSSVPNENSHAWLGKGTLSKRLNHFNLQVRQWIKK